MDEWIVVVSPDGIVIDVNGACLSNIHMRPSEVVGSSFSSTFSFMPDLSIIIEEPFKSKTFVEVKDSYGRSFEVTIAGFNYRYSGENGKLVILRSIDERKRLEEENKKAKAEQEMLKSQRLESLGLLAGGIAHDFNNSLSSMVSNIEVIRSKIEGNGELSWRLSKIEKTAMNARRLSDQLLTFSSGGKPVKENADVANIVKGATQFALAGSNVTPVFKFESGPFRVYADLGQLEQVFNNLIINAKQAMPSGGKLEVLVKTVELNDQKEIPLENGSYVSIEFKDKGVGIPEENLEKIFDPFFTTKPEGRGLGLSTALSIIKNHQGHLHVKSKVGEGTSMTVYLPVSIDANLDTCRNNTGKIGLGTGRILVMDDDEEILEVLSTLLDGIGYSVVATKNGEGAVAAYRKSISEGKRFDLVIMDLTIKGGMGGKEAIKEIAAFDPSIKAIVSSGYSNDPIMANPHEYGFHAILAKPYTLQDLKEAINNILESRGVEEESVPELHERAHS
ncbi:MAG TPA: ATP-binding protein [Methanomassiliicoccales archaeon]|nr:ATP-binding protein [Methanomassiliicoccales archaeon]